MNNKSPKDSRRCRLKPNRGRWTILSEDFGCLIHNELKISCERNNINCKNYVPVFTIPMLFSFLRSFSIEVENFRELEYGYKSSLLIKLESSSSNDALLICGYYHIPKEIIKKMELLTQIRNEIIHPSPYPENGSNLPEYLYKLKELNILWEPSSYFLVHNILDYFCSHELLKWGVTIVLDISEIMLQQAGDIAFIKDMHKQLFEELRKETV
jgi:hypothetical protein